MERTNFKLAVFDMDGVLTQIPSSWEFVHREIGVDNLMNLSLYRKGELPYIEFLRSDVELWIKKMGTVPSSLVKDILEKVPLRNGITETMSSLRRDGIRTAIISGGIYWLAERIGKIGEFNEIHANIIKTSGNGEIIPDGTVMVDPKRKDLILQDLQKHLGITEEETFSVGDTLQDVALFRHSGYSIAFNPHEHSMIKNASVTLTGNDLRAVLEQIQKQ